ncbi:MAG: type II secretion system protein GspN [Deltaproteobacteria bacterium]|nr:type II secretion system protein GspN [Deltaproteobacteria bacterium]
MRLPRGILKSKSDSSAQHKAPLHKTQRLILPGTILFFAVFFAGIYLFFPVSALKDRLLQEVAARTSAQMSIENVAVRPLLNVVAHQLSITDSWLPRPIEIDRLVIAPLWTSLFGGDPALTINAEVYGGDMTCDWSQEGQIQLLANRIHLDLPVNSPIAFRLDAMLDSAQLNTRSRLDNDTLTELDLTFHRTRVRGLKLAGDRSSELDLGKVRLRVDGQGRTMRIKSLTAEQADVDINGSGVVFIGRTVSSSRLDVRVNIRPGPNLDQEIASLLELIGKPNPDGLYTVRVSGPLNDPRVKLGG